LAATIKQSRPELLTNIPIGSGKGIPAEPPPHFFAKQVPNVDGVGEPITASFFTLSEADPQGWSVEPY